MKITLDIDAEDQITGEIAIVIKPGTVASVQSRAIDDALEPVMSEKARSLGVVLDAAPSRFARQLPGKDEEGRIRFAIAARVEGHRLVPAHKKHGKSR